MSQSDENTEAEPYFFEGDRERAKGDITGIVGRMFSFLTQQVSKVLSTPTGVRARRDVCCICTIFVDLVEWIKCVTFHSTSRLCDCRLMLPDLADAGVPFPAAGCGGLAPVPLVFLLAFGLAGACRLFGRLGARWPYPLH